MVLRLMWVYQADHSPRLSAGLVLLTSSREMLYLDLGLLESNHLLLGGASPISAPQDLYTSLMQLKILFPVSFFAAPLMVPSIPS
jgi:hypothetical protein